MKIDSVGSVDALSNQMSIAKINDDDKKQKQIINPAPGYKIKNAKLILKFNNYINSISQEITDDNNKKSRKPKTNSKEKGFDATFDSLDNVILHKSIPERIRKEVEDLLKELNTYKDDDSSVKIYLNRKNVDEFIKSLQELLKNGIYLGRDNASKKNLTGENIDFKA